MSKSNHCRILSDNKLLPSRILQQRGTHNCEVNVSGLSTTVDFLLEIKSTHAQLYDSVAWLINAEHVHSWNCDDPDDEQCHSK